MSECTDLQKSFFELEALPPAQQKLVMQHLESCSACRAELLRTQSMESEISAIAMMLHPFDDSALARLAVHEESAGEPDYDGGELTGETIGSMREHLAECPACAAKVGALRSDLRDLDGYLEKTGWPARRSPQSGGDWWRTILVAIRNAVENLISPPAAGIVAATAVVLIVGMFLLSRDDSGAPDFYQLAEQIELPATIITRSAASEAETRAVRLMQRGAFAEASTRLDDAIATESDQHLLARLHYIKGMALLRQVELVDPRATTTAARRYLRESVKSLSLVGAFGNRTLEQEAQWYRCRAYLLLKDEEAVVPVLESIAALQQKYSVGANRILADLR